MTVPGKGGSPKGVKKSAAHKAKIAKAQDGKDNSNWNGGVRSYRKIAGAKPGDVVDHIDGDRNNNKRSNLRILKGKKDGTNSTSAHERKHKRAAK